MAGDEINFLAVPAAFLLALMGGPVAFRRAGYPWGKTVFGTLAAAVTGLAVAGLVTSIQRKTGTEGLPFAWIVPVALAFALTRVPRSP